MRKIQLVPSGVALVDDEDYEKVRCFNWRLYKHPRRNTLYAVRRQYREDGSRQIIRMHREVLGDTATRMVDHIDRNGLNNQKRNLRPATHSENGGNREKSANNTAGYKGVSWDKQKKRWRASISVHGKDKNLGRFRDKEAAARAYNSAAIKHFGEFALTNNV